jgi:hypothetical protein
MKSLSLVSVLIFPLLFSCATHPLEQAKTVIYHPPVVFTGYVNNDYDSLPGNLSWPNTCELLHDTLRMHFYSDSFHVTDKIWFGDHLILTLLPNVNDSLISTRSVYLHMARYEDMNFTYQVVPGDSSDLSNNKAEMLGRELSRTHGSPIDLERITVVSTALEGTTDLVINNGRIFGTIP